MTDITYLFYESRQKCYLSTVLDAYTMQILAWVTSESMEVDFVLQTVENLIRDHGVSLDAETLIHSDQGSHYKSIRFSQLLKDCDLRQSMSRKANNAPQESFFGHMKDEIDISECKTFAEVTAVIDDYMDYYNKERHQWSLSKLSPDEFYEYTMTGVYPIVIPKSKAAYYQ